MNLTVQWQPPLCDGGVLVNYQYIITVGPNFNADFCQISTNGTTNATYVTLVNLCYNVVYDVSVVATSGTVTSIGVMETINIGMLFNLVTGVSWWAACPIFVVHTYIHTIIQQLYNVIHGYINTDCYKKGSKYKYRFLKDCCNPMRRMHCMKRRRLSRDKLNVVSLLHGIAVLRSCSNQ